MRTTLTLEPDVAVLLAEYRRRHGVGLKEAVNEALRRGLAPERGRVRARERVRHATAEVDHGRTLVASVDDIGELLEALDEDPRR